MKEFTLLSVLIHVASAAIISVLVVLVCRFLYRSISFSNKQANSIKTDCENAIKKKKRLEQTSRGGISNIQ